MTHLDPAIVDLARSQQGLVTTAQMTGLGINPLVINGWSKSGLLSRQLRGAYAVPQLLEESTGPDATERAHLLKCRAALLLYKDGVLGSTSAVLAHGVAVWGADLSTPIIRRPIDRGRGIRGLHVRRCTSEPVDTAYGKVVPLTTALIEHATDSGIVQGVVSADSAIHSQKATAEELQAAVGKLSTRWSSRPKAMMSLVDGRSESPGESRLRCLLAFEGWELIPQVDVRDETGHVFARLDGVIAGMKIGIEFDGKLKYADGDAHVLIAEKRREDRLRALGWVIVRVEWADLENPARLFAKIRRAMSLAQPAA
ncbi:MAG: hypothetical protein IPM00_18170 [Tetrasphaera sp.]|nr:hypothetical protein [Tetrasphaera sp.]